MNKPSKLTKLYNRVNKLETDNTQLTQLVQLLHLEVENIRSIIGLDKLSTKTLAQQKTDRKQFMKTIDLGKEPPSYLKKDEMIPVKQEEIIDLVKLMEQMQTN